LVGQSVTKILVTFHADDKFREAILKSLDHVGDVVFLSDLRKKERSSELSTTNVLISWNLSRELRRAELAAISNVRMLQLLSAGVDHLPFS